MPAPDFLDANVFVYAYDPSDRRKQRIAQELLRRALNGDFLTSVQALAEFSATLLHEMSPPGHPSAVAAVLDALSPISVVSPDLQMVRRAVQAREKYGVHFYDGMIIAAAERAGCTQILSEDLNSGQTYFGVTVENAFV